MTEYVKLSRRSRNVEEENLGTSYSAEAQEVCDQFLSHMQGPASMIKISHRPM